MNKPYEAGMEELKAHLGDNAEKFIAKLEAISPFFARVNVKYSETLDLKVAPERSLFPGLYEVFKACPICQR